MNDKDKAEPHSSYQLDCVLLSINICNDAFSILSQAGYCSLSILKVFYEFMEME